MPAMLCRYIVQHLMLVATETSTQMHIATARSKQPVQYRLSLLEFQSVELNVSISELCELAIITTVTSHQFWPTGCHGIIITPTLAKPRVGSEPVLTDRMVNPCFKGQENTIQQKAPRSCMCVYYNNTCNIIIIL